MNGPLVAASVEDQTSALPPLHLCLSPISQERRRPEAYFRDQVRRRKYSIVFIDDDTT